MARSNISPGEEKKKEKREIKELMELTNEPSCEIQRKCRQLN